MTESRDIQIDSDRKVPPLYRSYAKLPPLDKHLNDYARHLQKSYPDNIFVPSGDLLQKFLVPEVQHSCPLCSYACSIHAVCGYHKKCAKTIRDFGIDNQPGTNYLVAMSPCSEMPLNYVSESPVTDDSVLIPAHIDTRAGVRMPEAAPLPCTDTVCSESLSLPGRTQSLQSFHQNNDDKGRSMQVCHYSDCGYACNSEKFLQRHIENTHHNKPTFRCVRCTFTSKEPIVYKNHLLSHLGL